MRFQSLPTQSHFNPRSPWGERLWQVFYKGHEQLFQSTLPVGGATPSQWYVSTSCSISIHAPRGGSDIVKHRLYFFRTISIHAPRGGSDPFPFLVVWSENPISIHAPRGGSDLCSDL